MLPQPPPLPLSQPPPSWPTGSSSMPLWPPTLLLPPAATSPLDTPPPPGPPPPPPPPALPGWWRPQRWESSSLRATPPPRPLSGGPSQPSPVVDPQTLATSTSGGASAPEDGRSPSSAVVGVDVRVDAGEGADCGDGLDGGAAPLPAGQQPRLAATEDSLAPETTPDRASAAPAFGEKGDQSLATGATGGFAAVDAVVDMDAEVAATPVAATAPSRLFRSVSMSTVAAMPPWRNVPVGSPPPVAGRAVSPPRAPAALMGALPAWNSTGRPFPVGWPPPIRLHQPPPQLPPPPQPLPGVGTPLWSAGSAPPAVGAVIAGVPAPLLGVPPWPPPTGDLWFGAPPLPPPLLLPSMSGGWQSHPSAWQSPAAPLPTTPCGDVGAPLRSPSLLPPCPPPPPPLPSQSLLPPLPLLPALATQDSLREKERSERTLATAQGRFGIQRSGLPDELASGVARPTGEGTPPPGPVTPADGSRAQPLFLPLLRPAGSHPSPPARSNESSREAGLDRHEVHGQHGGQAPPPLPPPRSPSHRSPREAGSQLGAPVDLADAGREGKERDEDELASHPPPPTAAGPSAYELPASALWECAASDRPVPSSARGGNVPVGPRPARAASATGGGAGMTTARSPYSSQRARLYGGLRRQSEALPNYRPGAPWTPLPTVVRDSSPLTGTPGRMLGPAFPDQPVPPPLGWPPGGPPPLPSSGPFYPIDAHLAPSLRAVTTTPLAPPSHVATTATTASPDDIPGPSTPPYTPGRASSPPGRTRGAPQPEVALLSRSGPKRGRAATTDSPPPPPPPPPPLPRSLPVTEPRGEHRMLRNRQSAARSRERKKAANRSLEAQAEAAEALHTQLVRELDVQHARIRDLERQLYGTPHPSEGGSGRSG